MSELSPLLGCEAEVGLGACEGSFDPTETSSLINVRVGWVPFLTRRRVLSERGYSHEGERNHPVRPLTMAVPPRSTPVRGSKLLPVGSGRKHQAYLRLV